MELEKITKTLLSEKELEELFKKSREYPRRRASKMFHDDNYAGPQVGLSIIQPDSYIRPHFRYSDESIIHYSGKLCSVQFNENGEITKKIILKKETPYLFLPKETYITIISLESDSAIWMIVQEPHDSNKFKKFLEGTPEENKDYKEYFEFLKNI
ncbi:MAG: WbuC family cupin fold metalloprotein [Nanoarchaeota archaeon]